ncbi:uncharacterized protein [Lolium perenne]|uniref:uncharacterized protein isoform X2 n=1 Tax=Lolium perenne TaxID=4522 RepID=UPI003A99A663
MRRSPATTLLPAECQPPLRRAHCCFACLDSKLQPGLSCSSTSLVSRNRQGRPIRSPVRSCSGDLPGGGHRPVPADARLSCDDPAREQRWHSPTELHHHPGTGATAEDQNANHPYSTPPARLRRAHRDAKGRAIGAVK